MRKILVLVLFQFLALFFSSFAQAQSISPIGQEFKRRAKGSFSVSNKSLRPMRVVFEPVSFVNSREGQQTVMPLDSANIHLKLSQMSLSIPAQQTYQVDFEAECQHLPCAFAVFAKFSAGHTTSGIAVSINLPESFWICADKAKGCREEIRRDVFHQTD